MNKYSVIACSFLNGVYTCDLDGEIWKGVFIFILENKEKLEFKKDKIHNLWTVNGGHLRRKVENDALVNDILSISLPKYKGDGLILYRGECRFLYVANKIGFCWTPCVEVARKFASGLNSIESGGALLRAYAPAIAIHAEPNNHSIIQMREFEYTCNPFLLENIELLEYFPKYG